MLYKLPSFNRSHEEERIQSHRTMEDIPSYWESFQNMEIYETTKLGSLQIRKLCQNYSDPILQFTRMENTKQLI